MNAKIEKDPMLRTETLKRNSDIVSNLEKEVRLLRSFVIGLAGRDEEGDYRPDFVNKIITASGEKPAHKFTSRKSFLNRLGR